MFSSSRCVCLFGWTPPGSLIFLLLRGSETVKENPFGTFSHVVSHNTSLGVPWEKRYPLVFLCLLWRIPKRRIIRSSGELCLFSGGGRREDPEFSRFVNLHVRRLNPNSPLKFNINLLLRPHYIISATLWWYLLVFSSICYYREKQPTLQRKWKTISWHNLFCY